MTGYLSYSLWDGFLFALLTGVVSLINYNDVSRFRE